MLKDDAHTLLIWAQGGVASVDFTVLNLLHLCIRMFLVAFVG